jgi:phosphinothricin acetyltransferase
VLESADREIGLLYIGSIAFNKDPVMTNSTLIRSANPTDADAVARIYNYYIMETVVTFEVDELSSAEMARRMKEIQADSFPWLVAQRAGEVVGYAYAGKWHSRCAYRFAAEMTVYLAPGHAGQGVGSRLYEEVIEALTATDIHTVIGGIALPNDASVALHEKFGFQKAAHYREVGFKHGRWIDVGYWQRIL